jgi:hypothetical protein
MRLTSDECWSHLRAGEHGVLCTTGARGAIDAVPVCFVVVGKALATPIDLVKPKGTTDLGRLKNLGRDATATLLAEQWDLDDWSRLWWVKAHLVRRSGHDVSDQLLQECERELREKYTQYRGAEFAEIVLFDVKTLVGWTAADSAASEPEDSASPTAVEAPAWPGPATRPGY